MSHRVYVSETGDYVVLEITGEFRAADMLRYIAEAHAVGLEADVHCYLVESTRARNVDSVLGNYEFAYEDLEKVEHGDPRARVAALIRPDDASHEFADTVMENAGRPIRFFTDRRAALEYLRGL